MTTPVDIARVLDVDYFMLNKTPEPMGASVHECGTARMGFDPDTSVLDPSNQVWGVNGLYVTDGAAFPIQDVYNPTLTMLALTARAAAHATGSQARKQPDRAQLSARLPS
jgi:choline dehydrogenase-like flavoprotein